MSPPITCHVLNTVTGQPASSLRVTLHLLSPTYTTDPSNYHHPSFCATTNADGRVLSWDSPNGTLLQNAFDVADSGVPGGEPLWKLSFAAGDYFGGEGWWDEVEVRFKTKTGEGRAHWHVPLLLSPWSYTTYRGS